MRRHSNLMAACLMTLSAALAGLGCKAEESGGSAICATLTNYTPTATTPPSFATDIYPILARTDGPTGGCSQMSCHGNPPIAISPGGTRFQQFLFDPPNIPMAKASLMGASLNAPGMQRVVANNVGASMLAYKMSGADGLNCVASMCTDGASVGTTTVCGDPMPTKGDFPAADRIKILDWIALGAAD